MASDTPHAERPEAEQANTRPEPPPDVPAFSALVHDLANTLNTHCAENSSNTPDYVLAEFLDACLNALTGAINKRDAWYGIRPSPGWTAPNTAASGVARPKLSGDERGESDRAPPPDVPELPAYDPSYNVSSKLFTRHDIEQLQHYANTLRYEAEQLRSGWLAEREWRDAAMRIGELLTVTGPASYYSFDAASWASWCDGAIRDLHERAERAEAECARLRDDAERMRKKFDQLLPGEHVWHLPDTLIHYPYCSICGIIKRKDGANSPCKGAQELSLRDAARKERT